MSLEHLALAVQLPGFRGTSLSAEAAELIEDGLGGICLFAGNMPSADLVAAVRELAPHAIVAVDEEGGDVTRLHATKGSPVLGPAALGVLDDVSLTRATAASLGRELAEAGIDLDLAPVADVNSNPDNPVIGTRSFGAEPDLVARHVTAYVDGLHDAGVAACAKHFPGHGDTHEDSHLALPRVDVDLEVLRARELPPFVAAVAAGVDAVMTSHLVVPAVDSAPATLSRPMLGLLRRELGFAGAVVSDALDMAGASAGRGMAAAAVQAIAAGCDLLCLGADKEAGVVREIQVALVEAVKAGDLPADRLEEAAGRVAALRAEPRRSEFVDVDQVAAARRAIRIDGTLPDLSSARLARVDSAPSIAVGAVPWGIPAGPPTWAGPVILQVRDAHRVHGLPSSLPPGSVLVEYGWPGEWTGDVPRICTFGASVPSRLALEEVLRARGWKG